MFANGQQNMKIANVFLHTNFPLYGNKQLMFINILFSVKLKLNCVATNNANIAVLLK